MPPVFSHGRVSWFRYEEAVDDWLSITSIDKPERFGPLLKSRLTANATMYRGLPDNDRLGDPENGVNYFLQTLRPYFVKGAQNVEFVTFISKFEILLRRLRASWMDTMPKVELTAEFHEQLACIYSMVS